MSEVFDMMLIQEPIKACGEGRPECKLSEVCAEARCAPNRLGNVRSYANLAAGTGSAGLRFFLQPAAGRCSVLHA